VGDAAGGQADEVDYFDEVRWLYVLFITCYNLLYEPLIQLVRVVARHRGLQALSDICY